MLPPLSPHTQSRQQHLLLRHKRKRMFHKGSFSWATWTCSACPECAELTYRLPISVCNTFKGITSQKYKVCLSKSGRNLYLAPRKKTREYSWDQEIIHRRTGVLKFFKTMQIAELYFYWPILFWHQSWSWYLKCITAKILQKYREIK